MTATLGNGATFTWNSADIGQIVSISGPSQERNIVDVTTLGSTQTHNVTGDATQATPTRAFLGGFSDSGEVTLELQCGLVHSLVPADDKNHEDLLNDMVAGTARTAIITLAATDTMSFSGIVTGLSINNAVDEVVTMSVTIKVSGDVTLSA
tara:strand:- start:36 stop:488 length:453 start_codon:yes stop_codon:yes gene_type:complete